MNFIDLIIKKRDKQELSKEEIDFFINGVIDGTIPDYQISAMLMSICINSLSKEETANLTMSMAHSGSVIDLSEIDGIKVDKHSTGGVGDTTTLVIAPLAASLGLNVIKMSGKGLGHTGGTIDKLEAIPGFNTDISPEKAIDFVKKIGLVIMGQSENLAPADKILYSIRDVTGTVESVPLIASSIMSKKIAAGCDAIVLDIKCGNGAFMKDMKSAENLANCMIKIGETAGKKVSAVITDMNQPLGLYIGNSFEVIEAIEILKGNVNNRLKEISVELCSHMLVLGNITETLEKARFKIEENIKNKKGLRKFAELIEQQGGNPNIINDYSLLPRAEIKTEFIAEKDGTITGINTYQIGRAASETGAGRKTKNDAIDYGAGIILKYTLGDKVKKGDILAEIFASTEEKCNSAKDIIKNALKIK